MTEFIISLTVLAILFGFIWHDQPAEKRERVRPLARK